MRHAVCVKCRWHVAHPATPPMHDQAPENPPWDECRFPTVNWVTGEEDKLAIGPRCEARNRDGMCSEFDPVNP